MKELKAKKTDPKKYLKISSDSAGFGFDRLIVLIGGIDKDVTAALFLDKFAIFSGNYIQRNHFEYLFDRINFSEKIKKYYQERNKA